MKEKKMTKENPIKKIQEKLMQAARAKDQKAANFNIGEALGMLGELYAEFYENPANHLPPDVLKQQQGSYVRKAEENSPIKNLSYLYRIAMTRADENLKPSLTKARDIIDAVLAQIDGEPKQGGEVLAVLDNLENIYSRWTPSCAPKVWVEELEKLWAMRESIRAAFTATPQETKYIVVFKDGAFFTRPSRVAADETANANEEEWLCTIDLRGLSTPPGFVLVPREPGDEWIAAYKAKRPSLSKINPNYILDCIDILT